MALNDNFFLRAKVEKADGWRDWIDKVPPHADKRKPVAAGAVRLAMPLLTPWRCSRFTKIRQTFPADSLFVAGW